MQLPSVEVYVVGRETYEVAKSCFSNHKNFTVFNGSIVNTLTSVMVSAGNSFGEMNGGVDGIINTHLSAYSPEYIQEKVKAKINNEYAGELPIGTSIVVQTNHPIQKYLIYAATMRIPEPIPKSLNAYLAFRSVLLMCSNCDRIATPLFCTGAGEMDVRTACLQMLEAYESIENKTLVGGDWNTYHRHHKKLTNLGK